MVKHTLTFTSFMSETKRLLQPAIVYNQNKFPSTAHSCKPGEWHSTVSALLFASHEYQQSLQIAIIFWHTDRGGGVSHNAARRCLPGWQIFFIEYAFFIDYADRSCCHSSQECPAHLLQCWVESQSHRRSWPRSSCDLLHGGTAREAELFIKESNLELYLHRREIQTVC